MHNEETQAQTQAQSSAVRKYVLIAVFLAVVTAIEFGIIYAVGLGGLIVPILFVLSAAKFFFVAAYFMHLKGDSPVFQWWFIAGLTLALVIIIVVPLLSHVYM